MSEELYTARVLIVEDDVSSLSLLSEILTSAGNVVETAVDGREGLAKIGSFAPEVILMDLQMPGRDGFELARLIRVNPKQAMIPIVMISGLTDPGIRARAMQCGADDFMAKPLKSEDLILRVAIAARLLRLRIEVANLRSEVAELKAESKHSGGSISDLHACIDDATSELRQSILKWAGQEETPKPIEHPAMASMMERFSSSADRAAMNVETETEPDIETKDETQTETADLSS